MFRSRQIGARAPIRYFSMRHRPRLEHLEPRLPPGDALLGVLFASSLMKSSMVGVERNPIYHDVLILDDDFVVETPIERRLGCITHVASQTWTNDDEVSTDTIAAPSTTALGAPPATRASRVPASSSARGWHVFEAPTTWTTASDSRAAKSWSPAFRHGARVVPALAVEGRPSSAVANEAQKSQVMDRYDNLPLSFEANQGQTDAQVDFIARTGGMTAFLTPTAAVFAIQNSEFRIQNSESVIDRRAVGVNPLASPANQGVNTPRSPGVALHMQIVGGDPNVRAAGVSPLSGKVNYFIGNDPSQWHANIPTFGRVEYQEVYPGIDLVYYGNKQQLEYDFVVSPGADPKAIMLNFAGGDGAEIDDGGNLVVHTATGDVVQQKPYLYQEVNGMRHTIAGSFVLDSALSTQHLALVSFDIGTYDLNRPLIVDPVVLGYSTYLGASDNDSSEGIAVDSSGNAYVTGQTLSPDFPTTPGAFDTTYNSDGAYDAFVTKLTAAGSGVAYSTFLGGSGENEGYGIAVDGGGNAYVVGYTSSSDFPTTSGAFDITHNHGGLDAFVTKLSPAGSALAYSTFLGGSSEDFGAGIAVDGSGSAYVTGTTESANFPSTPGAFDTTYNGGDDAFVTKLNAAGSALAFSSCLGGSADDYVADLAVDASGHAYVTGRTESSNFPTTPGAFDTSHNGQYWDAFVTKLNAVGSVLAYSTFLGGSGNDEGYGIAVDGRGNAYVTGHTASTNFPTTPSAFDTALDFIDAFVTKLNASGSALDYSTFLGGGGPSGLIDYGFGITVDGSGNAYVTGNTDSPAFPTTPGAFDTTHNSYVDAFVTKLNSDGSALAYSTFLGGKGHYDSGYGIAVDASSNAYVIGETDSVDFPTTPGAFDTSLNGPYDAFVTKFSGLVDVSPTAKGDV